MPLYFIDSSDGERSDQDEAGHELSDDDGARRAALDALADMVREVLPDGDVRTFSVHVRSADGSSLYHAEMSLQGSWLKD